MNRPALSGRRFWLAMFLGATFMGAVFALQSVLAAWVDERPLNPRLVAIQITAWWAWVAIAPLIFMVCRRVPVATSRTGVALAVHAVAAVGASLLHTLLLVPATLWAWNPFPADLDPFREAFVNVVVYRLGSDVILYTVVAAGWHAATYYDELRRRAVTEARLQQELAESELRALRSQLQPHFVSNSLNAIAAFVREDPGAAEDMIVRLSKYFRGVLAASSTQRVPIDQELALAQEYLAIHQARFGERLRFEVELDPRAASALVPILLLQPLIENALKHGIGAQPGPGHIGIVVRRSGEVVELCVEDNGLPAGSGGLTNERRGVGLANSRQRLALLYDGQATLDVRHTERGTRVSVTLPYERAAA